MSEVTMQVIGSFFELLLLREIRKYVEVALVLVVLLSNNSSLPSSSLDNNNNNNMDMDDDLFGFGDQSKPFLLLEIQTKLMPKVRQWKYL